MYIVDGSHEKEDQSYLVDLRNSEILRLKSENDILHERLNEIGSRDVYEWNDEGYVVCSLDLWNRSNRNDRLRELIFPTIVLCGLLFMVGEALILNIPGAWVFPLVFAAGSYLAIKHTEKL